MVIQLNHKDCNFGPDMAIFFTGKNLDQYGNVYLKNGGVATDEFGKAYVWKDTPVAGDKFVLVEGTKFYPPVDGNDFDGDGLFEGMPAFITVKEIFDDAGVEEVVDDTVITDTFVDFNRSDVQGEINVQGEQALRAAYGNEQSRFIPIPSLFFGKDLPATAAGAAFTGVVTGTASHFNPGPTNLQPVNGSLYVPRQFGPVNAAGEDIFEKAIVNSVQETVYFVDCWRSYHIYGGAVHCGTNVKRSFPSWDWWQKINE